MSRELIAANIVTQLKTVTSVRLVTRELFDFEKLSNAQYPAILVRTGREDRQDINLDRGRQATIDYSLICYIKSSSIDTARNNLVAAIENKLTEDVTRGGYALDTQVVSIETDEGSIHPIGGVIITVRVSYTFDRGNA